MSNHRWDTTDTEPTDADNLGGDDLTGSSFEDETPDPEFE
jgi:hypothetical protein